MITYHRRAATNRLNRDCLSSSPSVCNVFINAQCHLYSVNSRRAPHAEAERETRRRDGHTRTHAHTRLYFHAFLRPVSTHPMPQHQPNTRRVLGCRETPPWGVVTNTILLAGWGALSTETPTAGPGARACAHTRNNDIGDAMQIAAHVHVHCAMTMCMCIVMCTKLYYHVYWCPLRLEEQRPRVTTSKEFTGAAGA
jgi:hypothetical protein